ncbi:MAG TPA: hypothetical protein VHA30_00790, partial [Patescibacteria group bacterium]|nr:hypothetical protein [Patescibacteria group bacterium]
MPQIEIPDGTKDIDQDDYNPDTAADVFGNHEGGALGLAAAEILRARYEASGNWEPTQKFSEQEQGAYIDLKIGHLYLQNEDGSWIDKTLEYEKEGDAQKIAELQSRVAELQHLGVHDFSNDQIHRSSVSARQEYESKVYGGFVYVSNLDEAAGRAWLNFESFQLKTNLGDKNFYEQKDQNDDDAPLAFFTAGQKSFEERRTEDFSANEKSAVKKNEQDFLDGLFHFSSENETDHQATNEKDTSLLAGLPGKDKEAAQKMTDSFFHVWEQELILHQEKPAIIAFET